MTAGRARAAYHTIIYFPSLTRIYAFCGGGWYGWNGRRRRRRRRHRRQKRTLRKTAFVRSPSRPRQRVGKECPKNSQSQQLHSRSDGLGPEGRTHDNYGSGVITNALFAPRPCHFAPKHNLENISKGKGTGLEVGRFRNRDVIFIL